MTAAKKLNLIPVDEYLFGELISPIKHEYLGGVVYAMAGARNAHNLVAGNTFLAMGIRLRGKRCQPFNSDTKIRLLWAGQTRFYYPDVSVTCQPNPQNDSFQDEPAVIYEVLSRRTRRIDEGEKRDAYLSIPSLSVYVLIEQETPAAVVFRRSGHTFVREVYEGMAAVIPLPEIETNLPLAEVYEGVEFTPEGEESE